MDTATLEKVLVGRFWPGILTPEDSLARYLADVIRNPDEGSVFARNGLVRLAARLPPKLLVEALLRYGYGGMVFRADGKIVGHVFGQTHGNQFHIFAVKVIEPDARERGLGTEMVRAVILEFFEHREFQWIRLGAGGDEYITSIWRKAIGGGMRLNTMIGKGRPKDATSDVGWINLWTV